MDQLKEKSLLICLPWEHRPRMKGLPEHLKIQCLMCRGWVCVNPVTFTTKGVPEGFAPVCGACALDLMDSDGGVENHEFKLTDAQQRGEGSAFVREALKMVKDKADWPKEAIAMLRENRDYYDASKSASVEGAN